MFDVLVYLYETYYRPDACPDSAALVKKLSAVGFESDEIQDALSWLDGLASTAEAYSGEQSAEAMRVYTPAEQDLLGEESIGFVSFLESAGVLPPPMRGSRGVSSLESMAPSLLVSTSGNIALNDRPSSPFSSASWIMPSTLSSIMPRN